MKNREIDVYVYDKETIKKVTAVITASPDGHEYLYRKDTFDILKYPTFRCTFVECKDATIERIKDAIRCENARHSEEIHQLKKLLSNIIDIKEE